MSKVYLVRDIDDLCVQGVWFSEKAADAQCQELGKFFEVTEFDTEDEPGDKDEP